MNSITTAFAVFEAALAYATKEVPFDAKWRNGTGYYDSAVHMVQLEPGEFAKSQDEAPNGRRILFIGTNVGTVVLFERYTPFIGQPEVIVFNMPRVVSRLMMDHGALSFANMSWLTGCNDFGSSYGFESDNIGNRLRGLKNELNREPAAA